MPPQRASLRRQAAAQPRVKGNTGLIGSSGRSPTEFLSDAQEELMRHDTVAVWQTRVTEIEPCRDGFRFTCNDGISGVAAKLLLATGLVDEIPELPSIHALYGISVHHCLYCDGFEYAGQPVAAYGKDDKGAELAVMMKHWIDDVVLCSDGTEVSETAAKKLEQHGISLRTEPIRVLRGANGILSSIEFEIGPDLPCTGIFFSTGCHQGSDLPLRLGYKRDEKGGVITDALTEETTAPRIYVAGDVSRDVLLVAVAIAEGAKAAVAINKAFLRRDCSANRIGLPCVTLPQDGFLLFASVLSQRRRGARFPRDPCQFLVLFCPSSAVWRMFGFRNMPFHLIAMEIARRGICMIIDAHGGRPKYEPW